MPNIVIIGAGLAGSEAALQLAHWGLPVTLWDIKPDTRSPAHHSPDCAEIVCSNSLGSFGTQSAPSQLKREMDAMGSHLLALAHRYHVPAGQALAVDRDGFSAAVTQAVQSHPNITFRCGEVTEMPADADAVLFATGPMTTPALAETLAKLVNRQQLFFFDAAAPIVAKDSIDFSIAFWQDRYNKTSGTDETAAAQGGGYINCPLNKEEYTALVDCINAAEKIPLKSFEDAEKAQFFESCVPVEVLAKRGFHTLRYGPLKPMGLTDPRTGRYPFAAVQLRQDNHLGTLYNLVGFQTNLRWGEQKAMIQLIPGLANAEVVRYGVMHRNTYLHSPDVLTPTLQLQTHPHVFVAGQLTGTEGYSESIATGVMAAQSIRAFIAGQAFTPPPPETMIGALLAYITRPEARGKSFQPINSNWGIVPPLALPQKQKDLRNAALVERATAALTQWQQSQGLHAQPMATV